MSEERRAARPGVVRTVRVNPNRGSRTAAAFAVAKSRSLSDPGARRVTNGGSRKKSNRRSAGPAASGARGKVRWVRVILLVFGFMVAGAGAGAGAKAAWNWVTHSPRFAIRELVIRSGPRVSAPEVRTLSELTEGDNILSFRLKKCVAALEIHPWVKSASVMRELPDRVVIEIKEREPVAVIALGGLYYVDADGEVFKKLLPGEAMDYPVFTGLTLPEVVNNLETATPLIQEGIAIIGLARHSRIFRESELSEIYLDREQGATAVRAADGLRIRFGKDDIPDKWVRLERTLEEMGDETIKVAELDLNYEGRATIRLREGFRVASTQGAAGGGN